MLQPGHMLGDYEVVSKLRSGGMADLYLAKREGPGGFARHVAIKVVHPRLARDRAFVDMFLDEARLAASISHPNVVHIEDLARPRRGGDGHALGGSRRPTGHRSRSAQPAARGRARHVERIDLAGLLFALMADELSAQANAMGRPSLAGPLIDTFEMEATPLQCLDRLTVPHGQAFDDDEATVVDGALLDELVSRGAPPANPAAAPNPEAPPMLAQDLFGDMATRPLGSVPAPTAPMGTLESPEAPSAAQPTSPRVAQSGSADGRALDSSAADFSGPSGSFAAPPEAASKGLLRPILLGLGLGAVLSSVVVYFLLYR